MKSEIQRVFRHVRLANFRTVILFLFLPAVFQERSKALGYMNSGAYKALEEAGHVPAKPPSDVNELDVHIIRCCGVLPRRHGTYMSC